MVQNFGAWYKICVHDTKFRSVIQNLGPKYKVSVQGTKFWSVVQNVGPWYKISVRDTKYLCMVLRIAAIATVQQALTAGNTITHEEGTALALRTPARKVAPMAEQSALTVPQEPSRMRQQVRAAAVLRENQQDNPPPRQDPKISRNRDSGDFACGSQSIPKAAV